MSHIEKLKQFLKSSPDDCFLKHALALEYIKLGDDTRARKLFEENIAFDPGYVAGYYHLGKLLERHNEPAAAIDIYKKGMIAARAQKDMHSYGELNAALMLLDEDE